MTLPARRMVTLPMPDIPVEPGVRPPTLFLKISLLMAVVLVVFAVAVGTIGINYFSHALRDQAIRRGQAIASSLSSSLVEIVAARQDTAVAHTLRDVKKDAGLVYIEIIDPDGQVFAHSEKDAPRKQSSAVRLDAVGIRDGRIDGHSVIEVPDRMVTGHIVRVALDGDALEKRIAVARGAVIGVASIVFLVGLFAVFAVVRPYVADLSRANDRLAASVGRLKDTQVQLEGELTLRSKISEELRQAKDSAEIANRLKSEFLANMSHEIRTPMNGVLGMTELALSVSTDGEQRNYLHAVKSSADTLLAIINDILDLSKIESGKFDLDLVAFPLRDTLMDALKPLAARAHAKGLELAFQVQPDVHDWRYGDPLRLRQIFVNLVGNALKFTDEGEIVVTIGRAGSNGDADPNASTSGSAELLHFAVRDTGIGIAPDKQKLLFNPFTQVDGSATRRHGGTGLGLAISKRLVQLMGGDIWIDSQPGQGSVFHFTAALPRIESPPALVPPAAVQSLQGQRVLIVDDNDTNRRILEETLRAWGIDSESARGGVEALDRLTQAVQKKRPFRLALLDVMMPEMDGLTLAQEISARPLLRGTVIIFLSSAVRVVGEARCKELGAAASLMKPVRQSELLDAILTALGRASAVLQPAPALPPVSQDDSLRILLAEDNAINRMLVETLLRKQGHSVHSVVNGSQAITAVTQERFDLILMDVQMPVLDGMEATQAIRQQEVLTHEHIPIVALTANAMKGDREECLKAGMDDYLSKPVQARQLLAALERLAPLIEQHRGSSA
jgi:signal transduction histidine kinase/DNA-binding response OmpR family regulator